MVKKIAQELNNEKISTVSIDITDSEALTNLISDSDLVMNFVGPYYAFGTKPLETIIDAGVNYIDIMDDYDQTVEVLKLDERAKENNVSAVIGLGASPGMTNILARLASDALDQTEEIHTNWVVGESEIGGENGIGAFLHFFHIIDGKVPTFEDGKEQLIEAFRVEDCLKVKFDEHIGEVELYHLGHPEPITLPRFIPGVKTVTNRGGLIPEYLNDMFRTLTLLGLTSDESIELNGISIKPQDFLFAAMEKKLEENPDLLEMLRILQFRSL